MNAKIVAVAIACCLLLSAAPSRGAEEQKGVAATPMTAEPIGGRYRWQSPEEQKRYAAVPWNRIAMPALASFAPGVVLVERKTRECGAGTASYLRHEGALCREGVWLEDPRRPGERIDSVEKLTARFAPVGSEAEAAAFVAATGFDLKSNKDGILEGHTLAIDGGYLVQVVAKNTFGCRAHIPTGVIFKVTRDAKIAQIAAEEEPEGKPPVMCVD